ncbi:hypothetical protein [Mongoliitalea daihaiensis]|uniref:hypothetical protein n=1 Tax=Mongoliitalea daihaiensis TaxID=2782006 RepID=UPI001F26C2B2|nr:hypothetical protein [Mongoliitalea daihaiensis]UJP64006.1 hypothetical protein IPZ59_14405 [Mongoliitalea daihaiensis]
MSKSSEEFDDMLLDPDLIKYGEDGEIIGVYNEETGEVEPYGKKPESNDPPPSPPAPNPANPKDDPKPAAEPAKKPEDKNKDQGSNQEFANAADFILKTGGYDLDEIEFEDGRKVKIADLTPEDQLTIVTNEFVRMQEEFAEEIKKAPETAFKNDEERELIDFLRNGGTAKDLAKYILESDPENAHKQLTDDELVLENLKTIYKGASEEEIQEEFKILKDAGRVEKRAAFLRQKISSGEIKFADISAKHKEAIEARRESERSEEIEEAKKIIETAKKTTEIAGIPIDPKVTAAIVKDLVPDNIDDESEFYKSLADPAKLLRMRFLDVHAEKIFEHISNQAFAEGMKTERERLENEIADLKAKLNIKDRHLQKFSDKPIVTFSKAAPTNSKPSKSSSEEEEIF